jgi:hypothetical protein
VNRGLALLLANVGGASGALSAVAEFAFTLMVILWIFVFGDDNWPAWVERTLNVSIPVLGLVLWAGIARLIWRLLTASPRAG